MSPKKEAAIWRKIGAGFERLVERREKLQAGAQRRHPFGAGLCFAAEKFGLPAYSQFGARILTWDGHGPYFDDGWVELRERQQAASHRALTAYLLAEMVLDGCAPEATTTI